jgi:hypothetical protein
MIFHDYTLMAGRVHSRRRWDTRALSPEALDVCAGLLERLRAGEAQVEHGQEGLPPFWVGLGLSKQFPEALGYELFFCVGGRNQEAFQYNVVIHHHTDPGPGLWGLTTALAISFGGERPEGLTAHSLEETVAPLYHERPLLETALLPLAGLDLKVVTVAADFATCFAATWLLADA